MMGNRAKGGEQETKREQIGERETTAVEGENGMGR
jgi:hypothetical protein